MELKRLHSDVITKTRSAFTLNTVCQCILELVLNSLDAKATAIAIRINLVTLRIQVVDNGEGISSENMILIGNRYFTNKCNNLEELEKYIEFYGFRGEALANLIDLSKLVNITSKHSSSTKTFSKTLGRNSNGVVSLDKNRPSVGTTITVEGLFENFPVRKKRLVKELELEDIKRNITSLIIIHPVVTFSLRDDITGELVLSSRKSNDIPSAFKIIHPETEDGVVMKISKGKMSINSLLFKSYSENKNKQYIYVNKRPIYSSKIQKLISKLFNKNLKHQRNVENKKIYPMYVLNVKCPYSDVDILLNSSKTMVQFKNWDRVEHCILKLINCFFGKSQTKENIKARPEKKDELIQSNCVSQINGVVQAFGYKRKTDSTYKSVEKLKKFDEPLLPEKSILKNNIKEQNLKITENPHETYDIIESSFYKEKTKSFKKPLPITIVPKEKQLCLKKKLEINNTSEKCQNVDDTLSKFTNDENKGKHLILDMFLKSTQVYKSDENIQNTTQGSGETIYEEESNFLMENNVQTMYDGKSKTMSISVNLKNTKKIKRHKKLIGEKCIQTTFDNKMVSKGLQTTVKDNKSIIFQEGENITMLPENYTLMFTNSKSSQFKFVYKKSQSPKKFEFAFAKTCSCNCHSNICFNFEKDDSKTTNLLNKNMKESKNVEKDNFSLCNRNDVKYANLKRNWYKNKFNYFGKNNYKYSILNRQEPTPFKYKDFDLPKKNNKLNAEYKHNYHDFGKNDCNYLDILNRNIQHSPEPKTKTTKAYKDNWQWDINKKAKLSKKQDYEQSPYFIPQKHYQSNYINIHNNNRNEHNHHMPVINPHYKFNLFKNQNVDPFLDANIPSFTQFKPFYKSTQQNQYPWDFFPNTEHDQKEFHLNTNVQLEHQKTDDINASFELTIAPFEHFKPIYKSTQNRNLESNYSKDEYQHNANFGNFQQEYFNNSKNHGIKFQNVTESCTKISDHDFNKNTEQQIEESNQKMSDLEVTLSEREKQNLLDKELVAEKSLLIKDFLEWNSQFTHEESGVKEEWNWTKRDHFGSSYYVNKNTGYATFKTPKANNIFKLVERYDFLPKGMSPIIKEVKNVDKSLSQKGKDTLFEYILETYKDDLLFVKWQHYLKDLDGRKFFDNLYKEKLKMFEPCVPIGTVNKKQDIINLNKNIFENLEIIGQMDKKFIVVKELEENMLLVFDQHAVHERIRLEKLMNIYKNAKFVCKEKLMYFMSQNELSMLIRHESYLDYIGMTVEFFSNGVYVTEVPLCLHFKFKEEASTNSLNKMIHMLINEVIELLKSTRGVSLKILPTLMQNVINLEACRGAIKFGDLLDLKQCSELLKKLSTTDLPFQCAHGRPTVTPLMKLSLKSADNTVNLKKLKKLN